MDEIDETGPSWLSLDPIASVASESLLLRDGIVFDLFAYTVMPNHLHVVCGLGCHELATEGKFGREENERGGAEAPLTEIFSSFKKYTARRANQILHRHGPFWQDESYDHLIRTAEELKQTIWYVLENPVKAGLVEDWSDWKWTYCKPGLI